MKPHTITVEELINWDNWYTYASSSQEQKRILFAAIGSNIRIIHGQEIMYEGSDIEIAVDIYNAIVSKPIETVKLDN